ncbi:MAG: hypothetical protein MR260_10465 [Spirochaetia bacterium]|nr:hypothetical protein [Spirochaetia bacterium]
MANRFKMLPAANIKKLALILFFVLFVFAVVSAQDVNAEAEDSLTAEENKEQVEDLPVENFWQTLEWNEENPENVLCYQIEIEKYNSKAKDYESILSIKTENNSTSIKIEPALSCGVYRYKIISYDLLGLDAVESDWNELVIYKAFKPEIKGVSANVNYSSTIYLEEYNDGIFNIAGKNLFELPEDDKDISYTTYYLRKRGKKSSETVPLVMEISPDHKKVKIKLEEKQMDTGSYYFVAKDASGLESDLDSDASLVIKYKKMFDLNVSAGYSVPYILYDSTLPDYLDKKMWPFSATAKATFIFSKHIWGYFGLGVEGNYTRMKASFETYDIEGNMITALGNFCYQLPVYKRVSATQKKHIMNIELHGGAGLVNFKDYVFYFPNDIESDPLNSSSVAVDAGIAIQYFFTSRLYTELQADFVHAFVKDMSLGMVIPTFSIGWQF